MSRVAGVLLCAMVLLATVPASAGALNQPIAPCGWLKLQRGGLFIYHGAYTTPCRRAAKVVLTVWRKHRQGIARVGRWLCLRDDNAITCHGPRRQWTQGGWLADNPCRACGQIHLAARNRSRPPAGRAS